MFSNFTVNELSEIRWIVSREYEQELDRYIDLCDCSDEERKSFYLPLSEDKIFSLRDILLKLELEIAFTTKKEKGD